MLFVLAKVSGDKKSLTLIYQIEKSSVEILENHLAALRQLYRGGSLADDSKRCLDEGKENPHI